MDAATTTALLSYAGQSMVAKKEDAPDGTAQRRRRVIVESDDEDGAAGGRINREKKPPPSSAQASAPVPAQGASEVGSRAVGAPPVEKQKSLKRALPDGLLEHQPKRPGAAHRRPAAHRSNAHSAESASLHGEGTKTPAAAPSGPSFIVTMDAFMRNLLSWDVVAAVHDARSGDRRSRAESEGRAKGAEDDAEVERHVVPTTFRTATEYQRAWFPLCLDEVRGTRHNGRVRGAPHHRGVVYPDACAFCRRAISLSSFSSSHCAAPHPCVLSTASCPGSVSDHG